MEALTCCRLPSVTSTVMRFFSPSTLERTSALLASSLALSTAYSDCILLMASEYAGIQLGAFDGVLGLHFAHGIGFIVHLLGGFQLDDVAVVGLDRGGLGDDILFLGDGVEFDDHVALFHGDAVVGKVDDAQAGGGGSFQNAGTGALDIAAGADADDEIGAAPAARPPPR